ncbi:disease resistance protein At4g27190-like isoform X2 [Prunus avium]|uniref:Disease resistance protein At4g27190-like isoform X2 n=1 Tax=Prunus avium TaxID=42229 RepID=A0A6P5THT2_PRUAV|nr:disease resistance protein At4g27190-like isoform X2 [Prunus avium]
MEILTGTIPKIFEYTVEPIGRQVGYLINYKSNLESLRSQLKNLDAAKDRMKHRVDEVERNGKGVEIDAQNWRKEADGITQEAEKILGNEGQAKTKCFRGVCPNIVSYHQFSRKSAKLAKEIELHAKKEFPSVSYDPPLEEICATPSQNYMAFESRILMVNEIMKELKNPDTNMIGVYGLGGVGKTTLAQEVYRQAMKENLFDEVVIVLDVKKYPDLEKKERIQKKIVEKLGMDVDVTHDIEARAKHLWNRIKDKNIFVILDDVWEAIDLEALGLRPMVTCKILLTSRDRVSDMSMQKEFQLEVLGMEESWSLFEKMAGDVVQNDRIHEVAIEIAKKCGGLPVLVVAVARSLRSASTLEEWRVALRGFKSFDEQGLAKSAYLALEWSYNQLDGNELKRVFLLCGIIAGGSCIIFLSDLLKYAMGLSLVKNVDTVEEARDKLISLLKKLIKDYCLLLDINDDGDFRMHELVRDVAIGIAFKDKYVIAKAYGDELKEWPDRDSLKKCTAISLKSCKIPRLPEVPWVCPELRFIVLENHNIDDSLEIPGNYFEGMKELKVLDATRLRIPSLPPSLQSLTNLQTLCLDHCVLGDIALVGQLTNLKILSLVHSQVKELPKEIGQLTHLQLLDLTGCSELVLIPPGVISSLTSLEDLRMGSFKEWEGGLIDGRSNASVSELKQLRQLTALDIHIPDAKLLPANMFSDTRLERYTILIGDCWPRYPRIYGTSMLKLKLTSNSQFDQGIKLLLKRCEDLDLDGMKAANIISYILASDSGKQLKNLHVQNNDEVTSLINSSHAFPILESLSLYNLVNLETVCCGQLIAQPFQQLQSLTLWNLPKLSGFSSKGSRSVVSTEAEEIILENEIGGPVKLFMNEEVLMPNLTRLILHQCDGLKFLFSCSMARRLLQLEHIEISKCHMMEEIVSTSGYNQEHTNNIAHLDLVVMDSCDSLKNIFPPSVAKGLQQLSELYVENCGILEEIVANDGLETTPEFVLSKVTLVQLQRLPQLRSFYPGLHVSKWPSLKSLRFFECFQVEILASEYSIFQERLDLGTPIEQPFFLVDKGNPFPNLESLYLCKNTEIWYEAHDPLGRRSNASLSELKQLHQLTALVIHFPDAKLLPANMFSDTRLERYTTVIGDCWLFPDIDETFSNMLKLKLTTNSQFDQGIKLLLKRCEDLDLDGMEAANIISHILASDSGKQLKNLHVQNNDEVTSLINSSHDHAFPILESLSLYNLVNLETVCCGQLIAQPFQKLRSLTLWNVPKLIGFSSKGSTSVESREAEEIILENEIGGPTKPFMNGEVLMVNLTHLILHQCDGLRFLFSSSMAKSLEQLEHIEISKCQMMEEIVSTSGYNEEHTDSMFCNLKSLKLQRLPSLTRFYSGSYIEFSLLEKLHIEDCPRLGTFIVDGKSEITTMGKENEDRNSKENLETVIPHFLFDEKVGFPSLERLIIHDLPALMTIWHNQLAQDSFCRLKEVNVYRCHNLINIFARSMIGRLNALYTLQIWQCQSLQVVFELGGVFEAYDTSTTQLKTFECPNLDFVEIDACERLINIFSASVAKGLEQLTKLSVENCGLMEINGKEKGSGAMPLCFQK